MKICFFTSQFFPQIGGAEFMVHHLAQRYVNKSHQVSVLAPVPNSTASGAYQVHPIKNLSNQLSRAEDKWERGNRVLSWNLTEEKNRFDFDVLHAHFAYPYGYVAGVWGKKHRVPTVLTCHGIDVLRMPQWRFGVRPKETEILTKTFKTLDRVVTVSRNLEGEVLRLGCPAEKLSTIPNGVAPDEYDPASIAADNPQIILGMGRMEAVKGFDLLLEIFSDIAKERKKVQLHLVGEGREFARLLETSLRHSLHDKVVFNKAAVGEKKKRFIEGCTLFICPSRWEGMPLVVLEVMAAGKAVVAYDVGGMGEIIEHDKNGILIPPFDTQLMTQKVIELLDNRSKREQLGKCARQTALKHNWSYIADQYISLYEQSA